jgi:hypothetical protein
MLITNRYEYYRRFFDTWVSARLNFHLLFFLVQPKRKTAKKTGKIYFFGPAIFLVFVLRLSIIKTSSEMDAANLDVSSPK